MAVTSSLAAETSPFRTEVFLHLISCCVILGTLLNQKLLFVELQTKAAVSELPHRVWLPPLPLLDGLDAATVLHLQNRVWGGNRTRRVLALK